MYIFVGSENPVKINAVVGAASETWPDIQVIGCNVPSGISEQPRTDEETKKGALNRAHRALEDGLVQLKADGKDTTALGVGLEGGVMEVGTEMWSTVWAAVVDIDGNEFVSNGARFKIAPIVAELIRAGKELGPLIAQLTNVTDVRRKQGFIGIVTDGFVDRTEEYMGIAKLALGLWYGRNWQQKIESQK